MSKKKLDFTLSVNPNFPVNGVTGNSYKKTNHDTLNNSFNNNEYTYNVWLTEKQCGNLNISILEKNSDIYTVDRYGKKTPIYNISQTNYNNGKYYKSYIKYKNIQSLQKNDLKDYKKEFEQVCIQGNTKQIEYMLSNNKHSKKYLKYIIIEMSKYI